MYVNSKMRGFSHSEIVTSLFHGAGCSKAFGGRIGSCLTMKKFRFTPPTFWRAKKSSANEDRQAVRKVDFHVCSLGSTSGMERSDPARGTIQLIIVRSFVVLVMLQYANIHCRSSGSLSSTLTDGTQYRGNGRRFGSACSAELK